MTSYMDKTEKPDSPYAIPLQETWYEGNITEFWRDLSEQRAKEGIKPPAEGAATNFFPVKNTDGSYVQVGNLSEKTELDTAGEEAAEHKDEK